jgi:ABC-2 type transport system ATP-binding protein
MSDNDLVLETCELTKAYGSFVALDRLSMQVRRGQIVGLVGPNGAGKSTTIRILVGQARPTSGAAFISGVDCTHESRRLKRLVGYMPDLFGAYDNMRVHEYLDFFAAAFGIPRTERVACVGRATEMAGAGPVRDHFLESLSHGWKQRVAMARTLVHDPPLLILDEPANGLDPQARIEMRQLLRRLASEQKTILVSSHILHELSLICDQIAILARGRLRAFGPLRAVTEQLRQRRLFEIEFASRDSLESASRLVAEYIPSDSDMTVSAEERTVRFFTADLQFELSQLLGRLISSGFHVSQCREVPMDLEEAFMAIAEEIPEAMTRPECPLP